MAESGNGTVGIIVTRYAIPARKTVVRTQLDTTERDLSTRIGVSRKVRTNQRVHILGVFGGNRGFLLRRACCQD